MRRLFTYTSLTTLLSLFILIPLSSRTAFSANTTVASNVNISLNSSTETSVCLGLELEEIVSHEIIYNDERFDRFIIVNESSAGPEGWPELPSVMRMVLIPPQCGVNLKITNFTTHIEEGYNPFPRQAPTNIETNITAAIAGGSVNGRELVRSEEIRNYNGFWPPEIARIGEPVIMRGYRMIPVVINPLRWNFQTNQMQVVNIIDIELDFTTDIEPINPVINPERQQPSQPVFQMVSDLVINPPAPARDMGVRNGSIAYVLKNGAAGNGHNWDEVVEALEPLIEWRRRMGWTVELIRVANNANSAIIKNAIQEAYDEWDTPPENVVICGDTDGDFPMAYWDMRRGANHPYESDHLYVQLDGDDILPDAAIGRLIFNSIGMLENIVEKTVDYESDPFIGQGNQRNWQKRAAVVSGDSRSGLSSIDLCRWTKNLLLRNDYDEIDELYWTPQNPQPNANQFIRNNFNSGISFYLYRGWTLMSGFGHAEVDQLNNGEMLPFVILATCNTGDYGEHVSSEFYYTERFLYSTRGGAIGAVGAAGATHTAYNNLISAGTFRAIFADNIPYQGWAFMRGKAELYSHYAPYDDIVHAENRGLDGWECETYIFNLMGDPAVDLYTDVPRRLDVDHPNVLRKGESHVEITVMYDNNDEPAENIRVCLYKPDEFQKTIYTDEEGHAVFDLDPEWTEDGTIKITATGHNLMPYLDDMRTNLVNVFLGAGDFSIDDDDEGESDGDDDAIANPTERIELNVEITNFGRSVPEGVVAVTLTTDMPYLEVIEGEMELEEAPERDQSEEVTFVIDIGGGFPDEVDAAFNVEVSSGEDTWLSSVTIPIAAPKFEFISLSWDDEPLRPGGTVECHITVRNVGTKLSPNMTGTLVSLTPTINVPGDESDFGRISINRTRRSRNSFRIAANLFHIGGSMANLALVMHSENGFVDTAFVSFQVDEARNRQPFGPDIYGYICIDNNDTAWFSVPEYDWIEIDPHHRGDGRDTRLRDTSEEDDHSTIVDLPFIFQYYGEEFDEITICTNGWLAMGDCGELVTARNRRIPAGMVAPGMICPFWEDLLTTDNGGVYTLFDEDEHIFIIEWSRMRKLGPAGANEPLETFQVILYDPEHYLTLTGDGDITFQYLDVSDTRSCFQEWDTPYATVGIGSPDQSDGLTYTYWGDLAPGAAELRDRRAIKFTTSILTATGLIRGTVTDAATDEPIEGVTVCTEHGFVATTDEDGFYQIDNAPAEIEFDITASKLGYNDFTIAGLNIEDDEEIEMNFSLLHPEFIPSVDEIDVWVLAGEQVQVDFNILNSGNGPLEWRCERRNPGNADADPWELRNSLFVGEELNDRRIGGAVFINERFYVTGANDGEPIINILDRDGALIETFPQFGEARYGMIDLAWDGELIWGSGERNIFGFTPEGELVTTIESPYSPTNNIAWDPVMEVLWVSAITSDLTALDLQGNEVEEFDNLSLRMYGIAYWTEDPDDYNLYLYTRPTGGEMFVYKMNTENGDTIRVRQLEPEEGGRPIGAFISSSFDFYSWVFLAIVNDGSDDRIDIWQLDVRRDWMCIQPETGTLNPGAREELTLTLDATLMPEVELEGELVFYHNATGCETVIPITFRILDEEIRELDVPLEEGWNIISINLIPPPEMYAEEDALGPDIILMTDQLRIDEDNHHVLLMKDQDGNFYLPEFNFNSIPYWNLTQGYQIRVDEDVEASWTGVPIPADEDIPIREGWSIAAYFPDYRLDASAPDFYVLSPVIDNILIAKDEDGLFLLPEYNFSNMFPWRPGCGYQIKTNEEIVLNYPQEQEVARILRARDHGLVDHSAGFGESGLRRTNENMSVLITSFEGSTVKEGDLITAICSSGNTIGKDRVQNDMCGLAVWGNDPSTDVVDGLVSGEAFRLYVRSNLDGLEAGLDPVVFLQGSDLIYEKDSIVVLTVKNETIAPDVFYLNEGYPNPFNSVVRLLYGLPEAAIVNICVYDLAGRLVEVLTNDQQKAGNYVSVWSACENSSGIYWVKMDAVGFQQVRKIVLVK